MNHQHLVEFSTSNDRHNGKSSDANEMNDEKCEDTDDDDDENIDNDDDNNQQSNNLNEAADQRQIHNVGEQTKVKCTEEQQIKRLRKRKRRRRRPHRRRKSITNQLTFAVNNKDAPFNFNVERVMSKASDANESPQHTTSNSFASQKHNTNMGLRVRRAILWIKVDAINRNGQYKKWTANRRLNHSANTKRQFTLWVFHIVEPYCKSKTNSRRVMCCF